MPEKKVTVIFAPFAAETETRRYEVVILSLGDSLRDCQTVFAMMNGADDSDAQTPANTIEERSMMPGDGIIVDGKIYRCNMLGWSEVKDVRELGFSIAEMFN